MDEPHVIVVYESTRGRTKAMAEAICAGVTGEGVVCRMLTATELNDIGGACGLAVGSSTRMKRPLPGIRTLLSRLPTLDGLPAAAFGSYGWSGEAPDEIARLLAERGAVLLDESPVKAKDYPSEDALERCRDLGRALAVRCTSTGTTP